jgi:uncharacterized membrane protein
MRGNWTRAYWILPALLAAAIVLRCNILAGKILVWTDELLSWYPGSSSFGTMLSATTDTINSAPPLYFVLTWFWSHLGGGSPTGLRLFSGVAIAGAVLIMFAVLRRVYGVLPAILALTVMSADQYVLFQSQQARFHALFFAEVALAILILQRLLARPSSSFRLLALNTAVHAAMVLTSYISLFYSSALLGAALVVDLVQRRNPTRICLSIAASWLVLLPWIPVLLRHIEMSKPGWIPIATPQILRTYFESYATIQLRWFVLILIGSVAISVLMTFRFGARRRRKGFRYGERSLVAIGVALLAVTFAIYAISSRPGANSLFNERYLLASVLGWTILLAHVAHRAFLIRHPVGRRPLTIALVGVQLIAAITFLGSNLRSLVREARHCRVESLTSDLAVQLPGDEPIVLEHIHEFLSWHYYSPRKARYRFLVDPEVGSKEGGGNPLNHAIMGALRRRFPAQFQEVMPSAEFLEGASSFYVRDNPGYQWSVVRLGANPSFAIEQIPDHDNLLHVRRAAP